MAGVDILCTDKTGTLTKNQLKLGDPILFDAKDPQDGGARRRAGLARSRTTTRSTTAVIAALDGPERAKG